MKIDVQDVLEISEQIRPINLQLESSLNNLFASREKNVIYEIKRYLSHSIRTPLPLNSMIFGFKRWTTLGGAHRLKDIWGFLQLLRNEEVDNDLFNVIREYPFHFKKIHPIFTHLTHSLNESNIGNKIVIVHQQDISGLRILLRNNNFTKDVIVTDWKRLNRTVEKNDVDVQLYIIEPPYSGDLLYEKRFINVIILGSKENNYQVKKAIELIVHSKSRPYFISRNESAPIELIKLEESVKEIERATESNIDEIEKLSSTTWSINSLLNSSSEGGINEFRNSEEISSYQPDELIVAIGQKNQCVIFPPHSEISWKGNSDSGLDSAIKLYTNRTNNIDIYLSKNELPIKVRFADWLINEVPNCLHESRGFSWESFEELVLDSVEWTQTLREEAEILGHSELALLLSQANLTAKRVNYIQKWWNEVEFPPVTTPSGILIYIPAIEHPQRYLDLVNIAKAINNKDLEKNALKIYSAAMEIQMLRSKTLHKAKEFLSISHTKQIFEDDDFLELFGEFILDFQPFKVKEFIKINYLNVPLHKIITTECLNGDY